MLGIDEIKVGEEDTIPSVGEKVQSGGDKLVEEAEDDKYSSHQEPDSFVWELDGVGKSEAEGEAVREMEVGESDETIVGASDETICEQGGIETRVEVVVVPGLVDGVKTGDEEVGTSLRGVVAPEPDDIRVTTGLMRPREVAVGTSGGTGQIQEMGQG